MERLRRELSESIQIGAALAGVAVLAACGAQTEGAPSEGTSGLVDSGSVDPPPPPLAPVSADMLGCAGPTHDDEFGFHGQCCFTQRCYAPAEGAACSEDYSSAEVRPLLPPGSGTCGCQVDGRLTVAGPFAPNPSASMPPEGSAAPAPEGSCCYVVGSIGCDGRPFVVNAAQRVAAPVRRNDWRLFA